MEFNKKCGSCSEIKSCNYFRKDKNRHDGVDGMCKSCRNRKAKEKYHLNPTPKIEYSKKRNAEIGSIYNKKQYIKYKNSGKKRIVDLNRRALNKKAKGFITKNIISELLKESNGVCFYCQKFFEKYHIDHFLPLSKGGSNEKDNLRVSCHTCNLKKGSKIVQVSNPALAF